MEDNNQGPKWENTVNVDPRWDDTTDSPAQLDVKPEVSYAESGIRGGLQGGTLGFADEATAGLESLADAMIGRGSFTGLKDTYYNEKLPETRALYKAAQEANPVTYAGGNIVGNLATFAIPGLNVAKGAGIGARIGVEAAKGALTGIGTSEGRLDNPEGALDVAGDALKEGGVNAAFAGVGELPALIKSTRVGDELSKAYQAGKQGLNLISKEAPKKAAEQVREVGGDIAKNLSAANKEAAKAKRLAVEGLEKSGATVDFGSERKQLEELVNQMKSSSSPEVQALAKDIEGRLGTAFGDVNVPFKRTDVTNMVDAPEGLLPFEQLPPNVKEVGGQLMSVIKRGEKLTPEQGDELRKVMADLEKTAFNRNMTREAGLLRQSTGRISEQLNQFDPILKANRDVQATSNALKALGIDDLDVLARPEDLVSAKGKIQGVISRVGRESTDSALGAEDKLVAALNELKKTRPDLAKNIEDQIRGTSETYNLVKDFGGLGSSKYGLLQKAGLGTANIAGQAAGGVSKAVNAVHAAPLLEATGEAMKGLAKASPRIYSELETGDIQQSDSSIVGKNIYTMDDNQLLQVSERLMQDPSLVSVSDALNKAVQNKDTNAKNAAIFSIAQNPKARAILRNEER